MPPRTAIAKHRSAPIPRRKDFNPIPSNFLRTIVLSGTARSKDSPASRERAVLRHFSEVSLMAG